MGAAASAFLAVESSGPALSTASAWMAVIAYPCWIATQFAPITQAPQGCGRVGTVIHNRPRASHAPGNPWATGRNMSFHEAGTFLSRFVLRMQSHRVMPLSGV